MKNLLTILIFTHLLFKTEAQTIKDFSKDSTQYIIDFSFYNGFESDAKYSKKMPVQMFLGKYFCVTDILIASPEEHAEKIKFELSNEQIEERFRQLILNKNFTGVHTITLSTYRSPLFYTLDNRNGTNLLIQDSATFSWRLTNEKKQIMGFECQKAIGNYKTTKVVAWFTTALPFAAGPNRINGLPGLILEYLNLDTKSRYYATNIRNASKDNKIFLQFADTRVITKKDESIIRQMDTKAIQGLKKMTEAGQIEQ